MSKSLEELQREYEENTVKLEQEKRKPVSYTHLTLPTN